MNRAPLHELSVLSPDQRQELRRRIENNLERQKRIARLVFFIVSLFTTLLFFVLALGMLGSRPVTDSIIGAMAMMGSAAFMGLLFQFISVMMDTRSGERDMRARITSQALTELLLDNALGPDTAVDPAAALEADPLNKPKRGDDQRRYALSDDGEILPVDEDAARSSRRS